MALMLSRLHDALLAAGASPEQAREAAEEVAAYERDLGSIKGELRLLRWMTATLIVLTAAVFWQLFALDGRVDAIGERLAHGKERQARMEAALTRIEQALTAPERRP